MREIGGEEEGGVGMLEWERRGKGNGKIIIMHMYLISSSDVYIHTLCTGVVWLASIAGGIIL